MLELNAALGPLHGRLEGRGVCVCVGGSFITAASLQILYIYTCVVYCPPPPVSCCRGLMVTVRKQGVASA